MPLALPHSLRRFQLCWHSPCRNTAVAGSHGNQTVHGKRVHQGMRVAATATVLQGAMGANLQRCLCYAGSIPKECCWNWNAQWVHLPGFHWRWNVAVTTGVPMVRCRCCVPLLCLGTQDLGFLILMPPLVARRICWPEEFPFTV